MRKTINAQIGSGKLESVHKTFEDNQINYEVEMTTKDDVLSFQKARLAALLRDAATGEIGVEIGRAT